MRTDFKEIRENSEINLLIEQGIEFSMNWDIRSILESMLLRWRIRREKF